MDNYLESTAVIFKNEDKSSRADKIIKDKYQTDSRALLLSRAYYNYESLATPHSLFFIVF